MPFIVIRPEDVLQMQIMRQFGELSPDLIDMQRYAAWKAADIRKALREGRQPTAGNPAGAASAEQELLDELGLPSVPGMHRTSAPRSGAHAASEQACTGQRCSSCHDLACVRADARQG